MATRDPWADFRVGTSPFSSPTVTPLPMSPQQQAEENRKRRDQQIQEQQAEAQAAAAERAQREWEATHNPDGSPKVNPAAGMTDAQRKAAAQGASIDSLVTQINRVQQLFNEGQRDNAVPALGSLYEYLPTQENTRFDAAAAGLAEQGMSAFRVPGVGAQSDAELRQFVDANRPSTWSNDSTNQERLRQLRVRVDETRQALGLPPAQWTGLETEQDKQRQTQPPPGVTPQNGAGGNSGGQQPPPAVRPWSPDNPANGPATGGTRTVEDNPALAAEYRARLAANQSPEEIVSWLVSQGASSDTIRQAQAQLRYRQANPNVPVESYSITSKREVPLSLYERGANAAGNFEIGGFSPGAYTMGAGQFLSGNTLDNLSMDPERARIATEIMRQQNPGSTFAGEMSGGIMAGLTGEAALARLGMNPGFLRGMVADTSMGAANGAGMADNGNRLLGAGQGALAAGVGNAGGTAAAKVAGRAFSPTGGELRPLYDAGVRPTPGQRFANSGTMGRILNTTEEALQSVPLVGQAIRGARQNARDQFQIGAFNEALSEIGEQLPAGMKPGTDPNAFTQNAFNRVYQQAKAGMRVVADEELSNELAQLAPDIATLGPAAQNKLKAIMRNNVNNRLANNTMSGEAFKKADAALGREIARYRNSAAPEDQALADVLQGVQTAIYSSARRHSPPEAVALLDAADAGYAKLVRIEEAAARRGGAPGTFSPANFDSAVQRASGGVRSKAYLRGDALMEDYARAGRSLDDTLPNSGTADRVMAGYAVGTPIAGTAAYMEPTTLSVLGAIAGAYAPGVRRATTGMLAPPGPMRKAIARQLEKRARLLGRMGAASGAASLQGTYPGQ